MKRKLGIAMMLLPFLAACGQNGDEGLFGNHSEKNEKRDISFVEIEATQTNDTVSQLIDHYLTQQNFNGVALVAVGDTVILSRGYGYANIENEEFMTDQHQFQIASVSKSFAAVSILQLVEAGKLTLNQTLDTIFPNMPNAHRITIHHLLVHTSGLYSGDDLSDYSKAITKEELTASAFKSNNLYHQEIGTRATYSNIGYDMLGLIVEEVTGMGYDDYLDEYIFKPAGMQNSGLNLEGEELPMLATSYNGSVMDGYNAKIFHPSFGYSSGGLHSTAWDLYKYDRALANNLLISKESYDLMSETYSHIGRKGYGYGWYTNVELSDTVSHPGHLIGWHSMLLRANDNSFTVILLTNHDDSDMNMAYSIGNLVRANLKEIEVEESTEEEKEPTE